MSAVPVDVIQDLYYFYLALLQQLITQVEGRSGGLDCCGHILLFWKLGA